MSYQIIKHGQLKSFDIINIYTAFRTEAASSFEGAAILISKAEEGHTFIIQDEKLVTKEEDRIMINGKHIPLTKQQKENNTKHQRMVEFFNTTNKDIKLVKDTLRKLVNKDPEKLKVLYDTIIKLRYQHNKALSKIGTFFREFDDNFIALFFQQKYLKNYSPTIYRDEKWLVEFIPEQYCINKRVCLYNDTTVKFRTYRRIRTIVCISPSDDLDSCDYRRYTTDDTGYSNYDRKQQRELKKHLEVNELSNYEALFNNDGSLKEDTIVNYTHEELEILESLSKKNKKSKNKICVECNDDNEDCDDDSSDNDSTNDFNGLF